MKEQMNMNSEQVITAQDNQINHLQMLTARQSKLIGDMQTQIFSMELLDKEKTDKIRQMEQQLMDYMMEQETAKTAKGE